MPPVEKEKQLFCLQYLKVEDTAGGEEMTIITNTGIGKKFSQVPAIGISVSISVLYSNAISALI